MARKRLINFLHTASAIKQSHPIRESLALARQRLERGFTTANQVTHHALSWILVALCIAYFVFCGLLLSLRYVVLPNIDRYKPQVEQLASHFLARPVSINTIHASWRGLHPSLRFNDVVIHNQQGEAALKLPEVSATLSWWSILVGDLRLYQLEFLRPDLEIERDSAGKIFVAGLLINTDTPAGGHGINWLLAQREIVVRNGWVRWIDRQRDAPELVFDHVDLVLQNKWRTHRLGLKATPPAELAAPIDLRAEFKHQPFASSASDYDNWTGQLYADWRHTNLEKWKKYIDYPFELSGGSGAVRAWLDFDRGVVTNLTADLGLADLAVRLGKDLELLKLVEVSGRISAGEVATGLKQQLLSFGARGHALKLTNFSLRTDQGVVMPDTTISTLFTAGSRGRPEQRELNISALDLDTLTLLLGHLPLSVPEREMLTSLAPGGQLQDLAASWEGSLPGDGKYRLSGKFTNLGLKPQPARAEHFAVPGFEGLSGKVDLDQDGGKVELNGKNAKLFLLDYFPDPVLPFDELALNASWAMRQANKLNVKVSAMQFSQAGIKGSLEGAYSLPLPAVAGKFGDLDIKVHVPSVELNQVARFVPSVAPAKTREWMAGAMLAGSAKEVDIVVKGNLDKFPFQIKKGDKQPSGVFKISGKIQDATLSPGYDQFAQDKRTLLWPQIDGIDGNVVLDGTRLAIHADHAKTAGVALSEISATIPDYWAERAMLEVSGTANGALQSMLAYVSATPVSSWIDGVTDEFATTGNARLALKLQMSLFDPTQSTVQGAVHFMGNELQLARDMPALQQTAGDLSFSEKGFQLNGVQGAFIGGPAQVSGGSQRDGSVQIKVEGNAVAEGVANAFHSQDLRRLMKKFNGSTRYNAVLRIKDQRPQLTIESSLAGLAIDLPAPLNKTATEILPLRFLLSPVPPYEQAMQSEEIRIGLGKAIAARYIRQRSNAKNASWKMVRGSIGVNSPLPQPDSGLAANVNLPVLNIDQWRSAVSTLLPESGVQESAQGAASPDFSAYVLPDLLGIRANQLIVADKTFNNAVLGASRPRGNWQVNIHSDQVVGYATWNDPYSERGAGKITARLVSLVIPQSTASDVTALLSGKSAATPLPGLDIIADNFELLDKKLGHLELSATNAGFGAGREWRISRLLVSNPDASLKASGKWSVLNGNSQSALRYELDIADAGRLLDRFGFERLLKGGKGKMDGELSWEGSPYAFDLPSLSGDLNLSVASGQFLKVDPGVAKLLGVMSLQSLPRRLVLDFRDLFSEGFSFDSIASTATIKRGLLKTDSFKMRGVNALVMMDGSVDLTEETQNLNVVVIPELNAGGASVLYGLAVNPVIGLGTFLAQLFLRNPLSQAMTQEYQITGPWKDPAVKKLSSRNKPAEPLPAAAD